MSPRPAFQAVVLAAGRGSRMPEVTDGKPKCLLPVGNKPLVWYILQKLQQMKLSEVIMIVSDNQKAEIQSTLEKTDLTIRIDYFSVNNEVYGTADSLRLISDKLVSTVIVLSCDLITSVNLIRVFDLFFKHKASACALFFKSTLDKSTVVPGPKSKHKPERDMIGIAHDNRLVLMTSTGDFDSSVDLHNKISRYGRARIYNNLTDAHFYILENWVVKYLVHKPNISSIKGELLPHIINQQAHRSTEICDNLSTVDAKDKIDILQFAAELDLDKLIRDCSTYTDHQGDTKPVYLGDSIRCFAYVAPSEDYGIRINNLSSYCSVNSKIPELWGTITGGLPLVPIHATADVKSTQVDSNCIVWDKCKLNEKSAYKSSIICSSCSVDNFSRVFNCILMNNVIVKENVVLENCIVCNGVVIEAGSKLKNCIVGCHYRISEKCVHSNEILMETNDLIEY